MNFSQCPDEFQIEQQFNKITHKTNNSEINFEEIDPKYKFTYPLQISAQQIKKSDFEITPQKNSIQFYEPINEILKIERKFDKSQFQKQIERSPKQNIREQGKIQLTNHQIIQQQNPIKSILNFQIDKTFINIRPNKKKIQRQQQQYPQQQIQRPQISVLQNNFKFQKTNPIISQFNQNNNPTSLNQSVVIMNNNISEISFHQEPRLNKFHQLLKKAPQSIDCEVEKTITWFGNLELCEGKIDGKIVQFIKNQQSNVII